MKGILGEVFGIFAKKTKEPEQKTTLCYKDLKRNELRRLYKQIKAELTEKKRIKRRLNTQSSREYNNLYAFYKNNIMHNNKKYQVNGNKYKLLAMAANKRSSKYLNTVSAAIKEFATKDEKLAFQDFINQLNNL